MIKWIQEYLHKIYLKRNKNLWERSILSIKDKYKKLIQKLAKTDNETVAKLYLRTRSLSRKYSGSNIKFISTEQLISWTNKWLNFIPNNYDIIIGIPRSGLLVASIISLKFAKPLSTPELFIKNIIWSSIEIKSPKKYKNVLLVDDTISSGKTMRNSLELLLSNYEGINVTTAALIATPKSKSLVDTYYKIIPEPRIFEWNMMHAKKGKTCFDMDGVLCENCPPGVDADEEKYIKWIQSAKPYLIPSYTIDAIISNRLEKYRKDTEIWLKKHNVKYKKLILWDIESKDKRNGQYAKQKIKAIKLIKPDIYFESSLSESEEIWKATGIQVMCIDEMILFS